MTQEGEEAQGTGNGQDQFRILVVQQGDSGRPKIEGIQEHGGGRFHLSTWSVPRDLPESWTRPRPICRTIPRLI